MKGKYQKLIIIGIAAVFFLIVFGNSMFIKLEATERGVIFRQFTTGLDKENVFPCDCAMERYVCVQRG